MQLLLARIRATLTSSGATAWKVSNNYARSISSITSKLCVENAELAGLKEGSYDIDDLKVSIQDRQRTPFVKGQARMADIEADHIADANIVFGANLQERMLIHHSCDCPMRWSYLRSSISGSEVQRRYRKAGVKGRVALAHAYYRFLRLRNRLHIGPYVQGRQEPRIHLMSNGVVSENPVLGFAISADIMGE